MLLLATGALAEPLRIATFSAALSRDGPGLLLRDILKPDDQTTATVAIIAHARPDVLLLTEIDHDHDLWALSALQSALKTAGHPMPHRFAPAPNTGVETGLDLNRNGYLWDRADALGYGDFRGDGGMALLSRYPINAENARDFSDLPWVNLPGTRALPDEPAPLSTTAHWAVPIDVPGGLTVLAWSATAPIFDGPEDRNGRRGGDEARLWLHLLDGALGTVPKGPLVVMGRANIDPKDGEGDHDAIAALLSHPRLTDPAPRSAGGVTAANAGHRTDPALDTADWSDPDPGNLRVSYVLPSTELTVTGAGVVWPTDGPLAKAAADAGPHKLVWVDVR